MSSESAHISPSESIAISWIRVLAMTLIIACHFAQVYGRNIAFLLNVGVQLFFLTSGFLYGKIEIISAGEFYKKRFTRVYVPYLFYVSVILLIQGLLGTWLFNLRDVAIYALNLQGFLSTSVDGLNHLWFLSVLMICYLITPLLLWLYKAYPRWLLAVVIAACIVEFVFVKKLYATCAWIVLYIAGMAYGRHAQPKVSLSIMIAAAVVLAGMWPFFNLDRLVNADWVHYSVWLHCALAAFIFATMYYVIPKVIPESAKLFVLKQIDAISYEVYLVHHPLIMGPLALLALTSYAWLNIAIILLITNALAYVGLYVCMYVCGGDKKSV
ncbi:MAG: acyltransferase [Paludibacteraceae bacterium]|nr:acyltransferase [Paludibacteraceae bacterium]